MWKTLVLTKLVSPAVDLSGPWTEKTVIMQPGAKQRVNGAVPGQKWLGRTLTMIPWNQDISSPNPDPTTPWCYPPPHYTHQFVWVFWPRQIADLWPSVDALQGLTGQRVPEADALVSRAAPAGQQAVLMRRPRDGLDRSEVFRVRLDGSSACDVPHKQLVVVATAGKVLVVRRPLEATNLATQYITVNNLLSLPPLARCWWSGDHLRPQT